MLARKDGPIGNHFRQNASHGPDVDGLGVAFAVQHDLRRAVPARGHVLRQEPRVVVVRVRDSGQSEITDLQVTRRVQQQIAGL